MIDTIVIEDEIGIQDFLVRLLTKHCTGLKIVGTAISVKEAISLINNKRPKLVFMDIELKDGKAFEILDAFDENDFVTIFLTGYSQYAIDGLKSGASDYLLKPIILKDLIQSVEKAKKKVVEKNILRRFHNSDALVEIDGKILVQRFNKKKLVLSYTEILYLESEQGYTRVHLINDKNYLLKGTLKLLCNRLPPFFVQIHRSHAINLNFVTSYGIQRNGWVQLENDKKLPVSSRNKKRFLNGVEAFF